MFDDATKTLNCADKSLTVRTVFAEARQAFAGPDTPDKGHCWGESLATAWHGV